MVIKKMDDGYILDMMVICWIHSLVGLVARSLLTQSDIISKHNMFYKKFNLKTEKYSDHLVGAFKDFRENFADVTLVCDDLVQISAHKVVLSAYSPVLKTILMNNPQSHPILFLKGIEETDLQAMLKFIYFGETQVCENRINKFVSLAIDFKMKEITEELIERSKLPDEMICDKFKAVMDQCTDVDIKEIKEWDTNSSKTISTQTANQQCNECDATYESYQSLKTHKESKHEGIRYSCDECDSVFAQPSNLRTHKKNKHRGITYPCNQCDFQATQKGNIYAHIRNRHTKRKTIIENETR